ncbi:MAG: hypothetical protein ACM3KR_03170 [Deltaproteobacteria bacterium]
MNKKMVLLFIVILIILSGLIVCYEYLFNKDLIATQKSKYSDLGKPLDEIIKYFKESPRNFVFNDKDKKIFTESSNEVSIVSSSSNGMFDLYIYGNGLAVKSVAFECFFHNSKEDIKELKEIIDSTNFFEKNVEIRNWINNCYKISLRSNSNLVSEKFESKRILIKWIFEEGSKHLRLEIYPS